MTDNGPMLGVIGGSGFYSFFGPEARSVSLDTPYGLPSAPVTVGSVGGHEVAFLPRHGVRHPYHRRGDAGLFSVRNRRSNGVGSRFSRHAMHAAG